MYQVQPHKKKYQTKEYRWMLFLISCSILLFSCKKFIEVDPPYTGLNGENVYATDQTAVAVLTDIYAKMSDGNNRLTEHTPASVSLYFSLAADELSLFDFNAPDLPGYYRNDLNKSSGPNYWDIFYQQIFATNNALEGLTKSTSLTPAIKQQLLGEARFMRAFSYFYLVNLYGEVPLVLDLDYNRNALLPRAPVVAVYEQIIEDLKEAQELLSPTYLRGDALTAYSVGEEERVRPTRWAATALLSRSYLYVGDYLNAETTATKVIDQSSLFVLTSINETFLKNNMEAIWQLQPVGINEEANTGEGRLFVLPPEGPGVINPVFLNNILLTAFETSDLRKNNWVDSIKPTDIAYYFPFKYKIGNVAAPTEEYPTILRLAEQYLIRAEARAQQGNISGADEDLNVIRSRAGLPNTTADNKEQMLVAILKERQVELFTEWGHRWLDLKRTGKIDAVMTAVAPVKGTTWQPFQAWLPIPERDVISNPNLIQNPNYW